MVNFPFVRVLAFDDDLSCFFVIISMSKIMRTLVFHNNI